jgi:hypothetical protein
VKVSLVSVLCFGTGAILVYSGVKSYDPRDVIKWGLGGKKPKKMESTAGKNWEDLLGPNEENPDPGQRYPGDKGLPDGNGPTVPA